MEGNRIQRPHLKYYLGEYYKTCWLCGAHGHYKEQCHKRKDQAKESRKVWNKTDQKKIQKAKNWNSSEPRNYARNSAHFAKNSLDVNIAEYVYYHMGSTFSCKEPDKEHLAWVIKN